MKKLAIIFFGVSYTDKNLYFFTNGYNIVDFRKSTDNYKKYIFDYFKNLGYEMDVFISTNKIENREIYNSLIETYKPIKIIENDNFGDNWESRSFKLKNGIKLCYKYSKENSINYDLCLITRFDLMFMKSFTKDNLDLNKMNIVSELESPGFICDNLYIFPFIYIKQFYKALKTNKIHHYIREEILKFIEINYIYNENKLVRDLSFYKIVRTPN